MKTPICKTCNGQGFVCSCGSIVSKDWSIALKFKCVDSGQYSTLTNEAHTLIKCSECGTKPPIARNRGKKWVYK